MNSQPVEKKQQIDDLSEDQIQALIAEKEGLGAENVRVVEEDGHKFLKWTWPAL